MTSTCANHMMCTGKRESGSNEIIRINCGLCGMREQTIKPIGNAIKAINLSGGEGVSTSDAMMRRGFLFSPLNFVFAVVNFVCGLAEVCMDLNFSFGILRVVLEVKQTIRK